MKKIVIVDDNTCFMKVVQEKLTFFNDLKLKFTAVNGEDLMVKLEKDNVVDLILMDIGMPKMNGIEATEKVKNRFPHVKIIMVTAFDNDENIYRSIKAGADGYLLKEVSPKDLYQGIIETLSGGAIMTPCIAMKTLKLLRNPMTFDDVTCQEVCHLSVREIEVLEQLSKGLKYELIAQNLFLSLGTIRKHVENIYGKLHVHSKHDAIQKARRNNII